MHLNTNISHTVYVYESKNMQLQIQNAVTQIIQTL